MSNEYRFRIDDGYTPATMPMERLGEYMTALARLLGQTANVHFSGVEAGSVILKAAVDEPARAEVRQRVRAVCDGGGPHDARKAYALLDGMLRKDNATATLESDADAIVVPFPGRERPERFDFGPFRQDGTLDGQVLRVGGRDETVPVHLRDGAVIHTGLYATPDLARRIVRHLLGPTIRVRGTGTWFRADGGTWELRAFKITDFDVLSDEPLQAVVAHLRRVKGSTWSDEPDPSVPCWTSGMEAERLIDRRL